MRIEKGIFIFAFALIILGGILGSVSADEVTCSDFGYSQGVVGVACDEGGYDLSGCYNEETTCNERDGGIDYFTFSNVISSTTNTYGEPCDGMPAAGGSGGGGGAVDRCQGDVLTEFYCGENGRTFSEQYECLNGCVDGACLEETAPTCSVDYLNQKDSHNEYYFSDTIYIPEDGSFYIYGDSNDEGSGIFNVQYNRTSPNLYLLWTDSDPTDGGFSENDEEWRSDPNDGSFIDGWHEVCCRAEDNVHNVQEPGECQEFCVDTVAPQKVENIINANPSECNPNYVNDEIIFSWDATESNGCAPIDYYEIKVYLSDGTPFGAYSTETGDETTFTIEEPENSQDYYIEVRAVDAAGNKGEWSDESEHIYFDDEAPTVEIISPNEDSWFNKDFNVNETDSDNLGLWKCQIKISNNGEETLDYSEVECNSLHLIGISEYCPEDGTCTVYKKAIDNACNEETDSRSFNIDTTAPTTTKTVSDPKHPGFEWMSWLIDWFVTDETTISFECDDGEGIGCDPAGETFYRVNNNSWKEYNGSFMLGDDGVYEIWYYSRDKLGNLENTQYEVDKVDTEAPETIKTISGPTYFDSENERLWVNAETEFTMECSDSEVGCELTSYTIDEGDEQSSNDIITFTLEGLEDGEHIIDFWSRDYLGNEETPQNEIDWLDTHLPIINVHNPTSEETNVERCTQKIVIEAYEIESVFGSGLDEDSIRAELWNSDEEMVAETSLEKAGSIYQATMDKEFSAGDYMLKIYAKDNVGNERVVEIPETLEDTIYVEYISPASCNVNVENGGSCDFNFNICMRGGNEIGMWMNKISGLVIPSDLDAEISKGEESALVGLKHSEPKMYDECMEAQSQAGYYTWEEDACYWQQNEDSLPLTTCDDEINGRTNFNLHLDFDSEDTQNIGPGAHELEYWIKSSFVECSEIPQDNETNQTEPEPEEGHIVINEFMANPTGKDNEWIELYNPTDLDIDLTDWTLNDGASWNYPLEGTINSGEYLIVEMSSKLNNPGDLIELMNNYEYVVDSVAYGNWDDGDTDDNADLPGEGESAGRYPNGQDTDVDNIDFIIFSYPTPGYENVLVI